METCKQERLYKEVKFRPLPESGINMFGEWIKSQNWEDIYQATDAHSKADKLQTMFMEQLDKCLLLKTYKISSDDKPWFNFKLKKLDRQRKREYVKHQKSAKWLDLNAKFEEKKI